MELPEAAKQRRFLELDEALWKYLGLLPASDAPQAAESLSLLCVEVNLNRPPQINKGEARQPFDALRWTFRSSLRRIGNVRPTWRTATSERLRISAVEHQTAGGKETRTTARP